MNIKPIKLSQNLSFVSFKIQTYVNDLPFTTGTAFFYLLDKETFLVTNWHNLSGLSPDDLQPLSKKTGGLPNKVALEIPFTQTTPQGAKAVGWQSRLLDLYGDAANYQRPIWWEHPLHGPDVDVAVVPLNGLDETALKAANDASLGLDHFSVSAGMDVFILGFPCGISGGGGFPLWKKGCVATEPDIDVRKLPMFYIDAATRSGMSGSPVYGQMTGIWAAEGKKFPEEATFGIGYRFLGVYSGRIAVTDKEGNVFSASKLEKEIFEAQVGKVWKEQAIIDIINAKQLGISSFGRGPKKVSNP